MKAKNRSVVVLLASLFFAVLVTAPAHTQPLIVKEGDTLGAIASRYGVTIENIMTTNGLTDRNFIVVGQRLIIRNPPPDSSELVQKTEVPENSGAAPRFQNTEIHGVRPVKGSDPKPREILGASSSILTDQVQTEAGRPRLISVEPPQPNDIDRLIEFVKKSEPICQ